MAIQTGVPSDILRPGTFQTYDISQAQRGLVPVRRRVVLVGAMATGAPATALVPRQIFVSSESDALYLPGSELALMARAAIKAAAKYGTSPEIWAQPVADPGGGVKATKTFTFTGPATATGDMQIDVAGRPIIFGVLTGDIATVIAAKYKKALDALAFDLPAVASIASAVVTTTAVNAGVNGNDISAILKQAPTGVGCVIAVGVAGTGAYDITPPTDVLVDKTYHGKVIANHTVTDVTKMAAHLDLVNGYDAKKFSFGYLAETGTLSTATTLSTGANKETISIVSAEGWPSMPGELAAQMAVTIEAEEKTQRSHNGVELDLPLPPDAAVPTPAEQNTAIAAGLNILSVVNGKAVIVRAVTTKTTLNGATFLAVLDISVMRTFFYTMTQIDEGWRLAFPREDASTRTAKRVYTNTLSTLRKVEADGRIQNVEAHKGELVVEVDPNVIGRFNVAVPTSVIPPLHQIVGKNLLLLE